MSAIVRWVVFGGIGVFFAAQGLRFQRRYWREIRGSPQLDARESASRRVYLRAIVIAYFEAAVAFAVAFYLSF